MRIEDCMKIEKIIIDLKKPTTKSYIVQNKHLFYNNVKEALEQLVLEKKIIEFETTNGTFYVNKGWKP